VFNQALVFLYRTENFSVELLVLVRPEKVTFTMLNKYQWNFNFLSQLFAYDTKKLNPGLFVCKKLRYRKET